MIQQYYYYRYTQRIVNQVIKKDTCTPMFIVALFTIEKLWEHQDAPQLMKRLRKCGIYIQCNFI
jgi:hypothetical protein